MKKCKACGQPIPEAPEAPEGKAEGEAEAPEVEVTIEGAPASVRDLLKKALGG